MNTPTVMDTIVKYSKDCIILRFIKKHFEKSLSLGKSLPIPFVLPSIDTIKIPIEEISMRIDEREQDIGRLITPLFEGKDFGHKNSTKHSLTVSEIREGYIILGKEENYVMLLRPLKGHDSCFTYSPGVLYQLSGALEYDLKEMEYSHEEILPKNLLSLIIKKKTAYEYLE